MPLLWSTSYLNIALTCKSRPQLTKLCVLFVQPSSLQIYCKSQTFTQANTQNHKHMHKHTNKCTNTQAYAHAQTLKHAYNTHSNNLTFSFSGGRFESMDDICPKVWEAMRLAIVVKSMWMEISRRLEVALLTRTASSVVRIRCVPLPPPPPPSSTLNIILVSCILIILKCF